MNDCVWVLVAHCDCTGYDECKHRVPIDSEKGRRIEGQYWQDVESALEPVWAEWERARKGGCA